MPTPLKIRRKMQLTCWIEMNCTKDAGEHGIRGLKQAALLGKVPRCGQLHQSVVYPFCYQWGLRPTD